MQRFIGIILGTMLVTPAFADADAWPLYDKAARHIREGDKLGKSSPSASSLEYKDYPPFPDAWMKLAKEAYEANGPALQAVHEAAAMDLANWPVIHQGDQVQLPYLNEVRNIANEVGDAALWEHVHGNHEAAIGRLKDLWHLAALLDQAPDELPVQLLVAAGVRMLVCYRVEVVATQLELSREKQNDGGKTVTVAEVRDLIRMLYSSEDPAAHVSSVVGHEGKLAGVTPELAAEGARKCKRVLDRGQMERNLAAMSLACQIVKFEKGRWPRSLAEITAELPEAPKDAFGPMGYVIVKGPKNVDRPMVYSQMDASTTKPAYPIGEPQYGLYLAKYVGAKTDVVPGQFRDVSLWQGTGEMGVRELE